MDVQINVDEGTVSLKGEDSLVDLSKWFFGAGAGTYNIYTPSGGLVKFKVLFHDYESVERDVANGEFNMSVKRKLSSSSNTVNLSNGNGISVESDNSIEVVIPSSTTYSMEGFYVYEMLYSSINSEVEMIMKGSFYVDRSVAPVETLSRFPTF